MAVGTHQGVAGLAPRPFTLEEETGSHHVFMDIAPACSSAVYAVYAISSPDTTLPLRRRTQHHPRDVAAGCGLPLPPFSLVKETKKRFAIDGEEGPQGLIVRQDELEDAPDDQLPPRVGERRGR